MYGMPKKKASNRNNKSTPKPRKKDEKTLAIEECRKLYQKYYANPSLSITNQLKEDFLSLDLSHYTIKDISVLSDILSKYFYFQQIEVAPYDPNKGENADKQNKKNKRMMSASDKYKSEREKKEKEEKKINMYNKIILGLARHLSLSKKIISFSLYMFTLNQKLCEFLSQALVENKSLKSLNITNCSIMLNSYEHLLKGLLTHPNLTYLDLSNNNFNDKYGNMISRIIVRQAQRRDQIIWSYGLRNEKPLTNDYRKGLISINLSGNKLSKDSAECISNALCSDQYIRAIDLSNNNIDNAGCKKFIYMMRKNLILLTVDLRNNPGYDDYIHPRLVMKMSKNIRYLYQQFQKGEYTEEEFENFKEFIETSFFDVDIPQEIVEFYNNNLPNNTNDVENNNNINNNNENGENNIVENQQNENGNVMNNNDVQEKEEVEEEGIVRNNENTKKNNNNLNINKENERLMKENLQLKQQIIELKAKNLQQQLGVGDKKNKIEDLMNTDSKNTDADYNKVLELINELNEVMNNIENKKKSKKKNQEIKNNNFINEKDKEKQEKKEKPKQNVPEQKKENPIKKEEVKKEISDKKKINDNEDEEYDEEGEIIKKKSEEEKNNNEEKKIENKVENKSENKTENKIENKTENKTENKNKEPMPYQEMLAEPSEKENESNDNSQIMDENGNIFNLEQLTEEEKMAIIQQQLILQKLQEEAEARGEHFDPQEYIAFLEEQAREEEMREHEMGGGSNKLNKSF